MTNQNTNIVSLLRERAREHSDKLAFAFLKDGITIGSSLNYGELEHQARAIAISLQSLVNPGDRALLLYSSSEEFLPAFFGCLYAQVIAVPTPAIDAIRLKRSLPRIGAIAQDCQATIILTSSNLVAQLQEVCTKIVPLQSVPSLVTNTINLEDVPPIEPKINPEELAYLQYTSGSTSTPKGVMISHDNLIANLASIRETLGYDNTSISATWTPYFHDYGLVGGLILPLFVGIPCYVMSPVAFIKRPIRWLEAISHFQVTHSGAPNFAYDYCVAQIKTQQLDQIDLSSWRVAHMGAETIRCETLTKFATTFQAYGFSQEAFHPSYGLAEATLMVTTRSQQASLVFMTISNQDLGKNQVVEASAAENKIGTQIITSCGYPTRGTQVVIVDPETTIDCGADQVGEIWVESKSVALGYWNRPSETQQTFQASLPDFPGKFFLRTGDLGFLHNGQLFVTGRCKDLIIIRGQNYYPQDIEFTVETSHPQLRANSSGVFSLNGAGIEQLVVVVEVDSRGVQHLDQNEIFSAISKAIALEYQLSLHGIVLLKRGSIPKTSSGKIQRHACRQGFIDQSLDTIATWDLEKANARMVVVPENEYEFRLQQIWQEVLSIDAISIHDNFFELGGDSLLAANVLTKVESKFGQALPVSALSEAPTIKQFAQCMQQPDWSLTQRSLVAIKPQGDKRPLFFVHPRSGSVMLFGNLARYLDPARPFYGLQAVGLSGEQEPYTRIEDMAAHYIQEIQTIQPQGPYMLGGRCFGGTVAFEMAQQLLAKGYEVSLLILVESPLSGIVDPALAKKIRQNMKKMRQLSVSQASSFQKVMNGNAQAKRDYQYKVYPGRLTYLYAENHIHDPSLGFGWAKVTTGKLELREVPGDHMNIEEEPNVQVLANKLSDCLNEAELQPEIAKNTLLLKQFFPDQSLENNQLNHKIETKSSSKSGYKIEPNNRYHDDNISGVICQPHVYELAKYISEKASIKTIIDIGLGSGKKLKQFDHNIRIAGVDFGNNIALINSNLVDREIELININLSSEKIEISDDILKDAIVICSDVIEHLPDPTLLVDTLKEWSSLCPYILISTPARDRIRDASDFALPANKTRGMEWTLNELYGFLLSRDFPIGFHGYTINDDFHSWKTTSLIISGTEAVYLKPTKVLVTAIINCYNEADIIQEVVLYLLKQKINVVVVDNWSTDGSYEIVKQLAKQHPRIKSTRFPDAPSNHYNWNEQLINTVKISEQLGHGWYIHYDADEIRESPWENVDLQDAISFVDSLGYNAIDFTLLNFRHIKDDREYLDLPPTKRLRYCEFGDRPGHFRQTKAWKYDGQKVNLNKSGGHRVKFAEQKAYPYKFLTRHYPLRSPKQSSKKLYQDRLPRFAVEQQKFGWHNHYNSLSIEQIKGWDRQHLFPWCPTTFKTEYLIERISGIGIPKPIPPKSKTAFVNTVCVLGMHRSGTSCLAGSLQAAGISGGMVVEYANDNLQGNRENQSIMNLNKKILAYNGGSWNQPPEEINFTSKHQKEIDQLVNQFDDQFPLWMFKDPRTVLTLSFWQKNINNLLLIGTFRHPFKVAMSLYQRQAHSIPLREGIKLWIHYNSLILQEFNYAPFPLICFDLPRPEYLAKLTKAIDYINSKVPSYCQLSIFQRQEFYDSDLVHHSNVKLLASTKEDAELITQAEAIYQELTIKSGLKVSPYQTQEQDLAIPLTNDYTAYSQAIKAQPNSSQLYFMLANIAQEQGNIETALVAAKKALELDTHSITSVEQLSQLLVQAEQYSEAVSLVETMVKSQPKSPKIYTILARLQCQLNDLEGEISTYQKLVELVPQSIQFQLNLGDRLIKAKRCQEAIVISLQTIDSFPQDSRPYFILGQAYFQQQNFAQAIASYQQAISLNCQHKRLYFSLGQALRKQSKIPEAIAAYQRSTKLAPKHFQSYIALGHCYRQQKKLNQAITSYQRSLQLKPNNAQVWLVLGHTFKEQGDLEQAIASYQQAQEKNHPNLFVVYQSLGDTFEEMNQIPQAISAWEKAREIKPDHPTINKKMNTINA